MVPLNNLPKEVLVTIFQHLDDRKMTRTCGHVCKHWRDAANITLYTRDDQDVHILSEQDLLNFLSLKTFVGQYFKSVHLYLSWKDVSKCAYLMDLLTIRAPNLEKITDVLGKVNHFIWILNDKTRHATRWPKLKYISRPIDPSCIEFYNACVLKYSSSLTHLSITDQTYTYISEAIYEQEYLAISKQINNFPLLENLVFLKQSEGKSIQAFDHMFQSDNLKDVTLKLYGVVESDPQKLDLATIKKLPGIKNLYICCVPTNDDSLLFMMHKFCGLKDITFDMTGQFYKREGNFRYQGIGAQSLSYSSPVISLFLEYIMDIPRHSLLQFYITRPMQVLDLLPHKFFHTLEIRYVLRDVQETGADMSIDLRHSGKKEKEDILMEGYLPSVIRVIDDNEINLHSTILGSVLICRHFKKLHLVNVPPSSSPIEQRTKGHYLDTLFLFASQLKVLKLSDHAILQCDPLLFKSPSITHLLLHNMVIANQIFPELSVRLPLLSYLQLWECSYSDYNGKLKETKQVLIDMPYTSISNIVIGHFFKCENSNQRQDILFKICTLKGEKFFNITVNGLDGTEYVELDNSLYKTLLSTTDTVNYVIYVKSIRSIAFKTDHDKSCTITL